MDLDYIEVSIRGDKAKGVPNQDFISIRNHEDYLMISIADGLGAYRQSDIGARMICELANEAIPKAYEHSTKSKDWIKCTKLLQENWLEAISKIGNPKDYRTTHAFVYCHKLKNTILVGKLGDATCAIVYDGVLFCWENSKKDFLNETLCLGPDKSSEYKIHSLAYEETVKILLATDGIGDEIVMDKMTALIDYLLQKYASLNSNTRTEALTEEIKSFLTQKNNDDKSIVFAWTK